MHKIPPTKQPGPMRLAQEIKTNDDRVELVEEVAPLTIWRVP